ncbi:hypothetical protein KSP40_PGU013041 [Platanthera guangdongensis]|uniref:Uncharacterized protein n=1 Tax=Platanthera guangdongensis TaxID=2320717 RepID=A0ABR2MY10_9ASPA
MEEGEIIAERFARSDLPDMEKKKASGQEGNWRTGGQAQPRRRLGELIAESLRSRSFDELAENFRQGETADRACGLLRF